MTRFHPVDSTRTPGSQRLTVLYITALSAIALLTIAGQISVQRSLARQHRSSTVINIAGRQRMLSQKIAKTTLLVAAESEISTDIAEGLQRDVEEWKRAHLGLQHGDAVLKIPGHNSDAVNDLFTDLAPHYHAMLDGATQVLHGDREKGITQLLAHEPAFLEIMDTIVFQYDRESQEDIAGLGWQERLLLVATLCVLLGEGLFIFRPAVKRIEQTFVELTRAKRTAEEANAEKSRFLACLSHDLRTPLNAILGLVDVMLTRSSQESREHLLTVRESAEALLRLVNNLLEAARLEAGGPPRLQQAPFDLPNLIAGTVRVFEQQAAARKLQLSCEVDNSVPRGVLSDAAMIQQTLMNLVGNALKFTDVGTIRVVATARQHAAGNYYVHLVVTDTGIGIPAGDQERVFGHFTQLLPAGRLQEGVGLGLSIVSRLVAALQGEVTVDSEPGRGSSFRVALPITACELPRMELSRHSAPTRLQVLVIEDTIPNQLVCREMLEYLGHACEIAATGRAGLEAASRMPFDMVLLDLQLPDANGLELIGDLRKLPHYAACPIIAVSAHAFEQHRQDALAAGFSDVLCKPVRLAQMAALVGTICEQPDMDGGIDLSRWSGHPDLLHRLMTLFAQEWPGQLQRLDDALASHDLAQVQFIAHRLNSLTSNFDDRCTRDAATQLEKAATEADVRRVQSLRDSLAQALQRLHEQLHTQVSSDRISNSQH